MTKKLLLAAALGLSFSFATIAQVELTTKNFELESIKKHKDWNIIDAGLDVESGKVYVKFSQSICDQSKNAWTGTRTYRGLKWNIDKAIFDDGFNYQTTEVKKYESSEDAIVNNEYVFGKTYMPSPTKLGKSIWSGSANLGRAVNNAFMFTNVVTGTTGMSGFKINVSTVGCEPVVQDTKYSGTFCGERPILETINSIDAKEEKGQRWIPMYNNAVPNGGNILFNTSGVGPADKQHYVFRKYDANGTVVKDLAISFDYQCLPTVKEIEKKPGVFDYVMVMTPINYKKSTLTVAPANQYEYIRIDGESFEIKEQFKFTAPNSQWIITDLLEADGAVYLYGFCGPKNTVYKDFAVPKLKEYTTVQIAKIANGKLQYTTNTDEKKAQTILTVVPGVKGSVKASFHNYNTKLHAVNGRLFVAAQNTLEGKIGALVTMVFDASGNLEGYMAKPEKIPSSGTLHFSANGKTVYWLLQDLGKYNKFDSKTYTFTAVKVKAFLANAMSVVKYDIDSKKAEPIQSFVNEEWALSFKSTVLYETKDELVLLGRKLTKKAKDSEIVFVKMKK